MKFLLRSFVFAILFGFLMSNANHEGKISADSSTTTCDEAYECEDDTVSATYINCYGYYSCDNTTMSGTYSYNYGYLSSYGSKQSVEYTYSSGLYSLLDADLETYISLVYGYLAASYAEFNAYDSTLVVELYGYLAGYYADVICTSGDTCYVYCGEVYGCYDLSYYCYSGATCYYDCSDDSDYCPTLYSGVDSDVFSLTPISQLKSESENDLTDDEITERYSLNREIKNSLERKYAKPESQINWNKLKYGEHMKEQLKQQIINIDRQLNAKNNDNNNNNEKEAKTATSATNYILSNMFTLSGLIMFCIGIILAIVGVKLFSMCDKYDNGRKLLSHISNKNKKNNNKNTSSNNSNDNNNTPKTNKNEGGIKDTVHVNVKDIDNDESTEYQSLLA